MKRFLTNTTVLFVSAALAMGCGGGVKKKDAEGGTAEAKKEVITQKGSDTMVLLAQAWSEAFHGANPNVEIQVTGGGSGTGISALINGTTDIANASRPMSDDEKAQVKQKYGVDPIEIPVALDGIAIYVNPENKVESLTLEQLKGIYSGTITDWKDVGGASGKIILYGRENSSGTYSYFKEHVLEKGDFAAATQTLSGTAAIVDVVTKDKAGIGYGGEAYTKGVKQLKVAGTGGQPVELTEATVHSGEYPISRKLYFYLRQQPVGAIKTFIDWVLSPEGQAIAKKGGYYPIKAGA